MNANQDNFAEQERANRLAEALDRLMSGEAPNSSDPLLIVARNLMSVPLEPSPAAIARFDGQVQRWFKPPAPRTPPRLSPVGPLIAAGFGLAMALVVVGIVLRLTVFAPPSPTPTVGVTRSPSPTSTATASATPTASSTLTPSETGTATPTNTEIPTASVTESADYTPTGPSFSQVVISGTINDIQGATIKVVGQPVQVQGGVDGLCVGDSVSFTAMMLPDGTLQVARAAITVVTSGCAATHVPTALSGGGDGDDGGDHHGETHGS
jgi:hypothetical protein